MPVFLGTLLTQARRRPSLAFLAVLLGGGLLYWSLAPATPVVRPAPRPPTVQGLGTERAVMEKTLLDVQRENQALKLTQAEQQRAMRTLEQSQAAKEEETKRMAAAQQQQMEGLLKQAQLAVQQAQAKAATPKQAETKKPAGPVAQARSVADTSAPPVPREAGVKVRILKAKEPASFQGVAPSVTRADTPYVPGGSIAEGRVVTGIMASTKTSGVGGVMLFTVTKPFQSPYQLHGADRDSTPTAVPIQGCMIFGKAQADLGSGRVIGQLTLLSCVFPDGSTFEQAIHGYVVDADNTLGLVGELQTHTSAVMTKAFLTGLLQEASAAFGLARSSLIVTQGGSFQTGQGAQTALAEISRFYLDQARELVPTLWVPSMHSARLVLIDGVALEGFPTQVLPAQKVTVR